MSSDPPATDATSSSDAARDDAAVTSVGTVDGEAETGPQAQTGSPDEATGPTPNRAAAAAQRRRRVRAGFAVLGIIALAAGLLLPGSRNTLFALGATGLFGALLVSTLVPAHSVPTTVGRMTYAATSDTGASLVAELGLSDERVYVPIDVGEDAVRLFVPQHRDYRLPGDDALADTLVTGAGSRGRGLATRPTGDALIAAYEDALLVTEGGTPAETVDQLAEALVAEFGLVRGATTTVEAGRAEVAVENSAYGPPDRFDHPVPSVLAAGLARRLGRAVEMSVRSRGERGTGWTVVCTWEPQS